MSVHMLAHKSVPTHREATTALVLMDTVVATVKVCKYECIRRNIKAKIS